LLARQIVADKPKQWEYKLLAELLRVGLSPIRLKWNALKKGLYALPNQRIADTEVLSWVSSKLDDLGNQTSALGGLLNTELEISLGPAGQPGDELAILNVCDLLVDACARVLNWEESVRFALLPDGLERVRGFLIGVGGRNIEKIFEIPGWMSQIMSKENPSGTYAFNVVFDLPDNWQDSMAEAFAQLRKFYIDNKVAG
jgi:hypothetical protein